jgi:hypothetical protein
LSLPLVPLMFAIAASWIPDDRRGLRRRRWDGRSPVRDLSRQSDWNHQFHRVEDDEAAAE